MKVFALVVVSLQILCGTALAAPVDILHGLQTTYPPDLVKPVVDIVTFVGRKIPKISKREATEQAAQALDSSGDALGGNMKKCMQEKNAMTVIASGIVKESKKSGREGSSSHAETKQVSLWKLLA
ncbi:hypothetical protein MBLNU457_7189t1 [Dothideomycetes sp. NU457]